MTDDVDAADRAETPKPRSALARRLVIAAVVLGAGLLQGYLNGPIAGGFLAFVALLLGVIWDRMQSPERSTRR